MRALGLDLGTKRIGVAISDSNGAVATPIDTIERPTSGGDRHLATVIQKLVDEWEAEIVVVGMPYSLDGGTGPAAQSAFAAIAGL